MQRRRALVLPLGTVLSEWFENCALDLQPMVLGALARSLSESLRQVHAARVIHRDVKPANIIVLSPPIVLADQVGSIDPRLADFGCACVVSSRRVKEWRVGPGSFEGSPLFASSEALAGEIPCARHDLVSLAYSLFQLAHPSHLSEDSKRPSLDKVFTLCAEESWCAFMREKLGLVGAAGQENECTN